MKFSASQSNLLSSILPLSAVVPVKSPMPVLSHILADLKGNVLFLTGSDMEVTMQTRVEVNGFEDGRLLLPSRKFVELLRGLPDEQITVERVKSKENQIKISDTEGREYACSAENVETYPQIPKIEQKHVFKIERNKLRRLITKCLFAVSRDELRPQLTGVYLKVNAEHIQMVTTDGHRLVRVGYKSKGYSGDEQFAIVPSKAMGAVQRISEGEGDAEITFAGTQLAFRIGNTTLITRLIEGKYPNYQAVIPSENKNLLKVDLDQLISAVRRAAIFSNEISRQIRMHLEKSEMQIRVEDIEQGNEGFESVPCEFNGEIMDIGYNAGYVLDVLKQVDTNEVNFELGTATSAGIVRPTEQEENEDLLMLIMPVRLN
jgi:DNA polymerase-3 subunit beta